MPRTLDQLVTDYDWVHTLLGLVGNVAFFVGSIFFLFESLKTPGVWLFIIGSFGMLIGSVGRVVVDKVGDRHHTHDGDANDRVTGGRGDAARGGQRRGGDRDRE